MSRKLNVAACALALPALASCTASPSANVNPPKPPVDPTPIIGTWCSNNDKRYTISPERFDSRDMQCTVMKLDNYKGTFTLNLVCGSNAQQVSENVTITPIGDALEIVFLSKGVRHTRVNRCGPSPSAPVVAPVQSEPALPLPPVQ
ncbi:hypothetical protein [Brucella haematophila]|jgi:hypothetical protein|uniref:hypothetical protein n=1 Tax=Brucella haematophila TaxID=419474 RepID=UPI001AEE98A1|nr:hypothetical protein [Brucella haematophila]